MNDKTDADKPDENRADLCRRVAALRAGGLSLSEIAAALHISRGKAHRLAMRECRRLEKERRAAANYAAAEELARLDRAHAVAWRIMNDGEMAPAERLRAVEKVTKVSAQRARLLGIEKPAQVIVQHPVDTPLVPAKPTDAERVEAILKLLGKTA
jgi:orotate phosphoribosyltransferase-like protein